MPVLSAWPLNAPVREKGLDTLVMAGLKAPAYGKPTWGKPPQDLMIYLNRGVVNAYSHCDSDFDDGVKLVPFTPYFSLS